jgi:hypothetical protein
MAKLIILIKLGLQSELVWWGILLPLLDLYFPSVLFLLLSLT